MNRSKYKPQRKPPTPVEPNDELSEAKPRPRGQFGLASMMLWMVMISVAAAVFGGLVQGGIRQQTAVLMGLIAPVAVLLVFGLIDQVRRLRRPRRSDD